MPLARLETVLHFCGESSSQRDLYPWIAVRAHPVFVRA
jgi:hypothetical protein